MAQPQVSDVGFGYVNKHESVEMPNTDGNAYPTTPKTPLKSPLKSAMRTPGAPPRDAGKAIFSPTFNQEEMLEKEEKHTEKEQARDVVSKLVLLDADPNANILHRESRLESEWRRC